MQACAATGNSLSPRTWGEVGETEEENAWAQGAPAGASKQASLFDICFSGQLTQGVRKSVLGTGGLLVVSPVIP